MKKKLPFYFFERPTLKVARDLLGKFLVRRSGGKELALMITEVEAYDGPRDRASHASRGLTPRTKIMFGPGGRWYVYFTYGMHWLLNAVAGPEGYPAAVLFRAGLAAGEYGEPQREITGPARLTRFLRVGGKLNGKALGPKSGFWIEDRGRRVPGRDIIRSPRVGVDYAGKFWSSKRYNFSIRPAKAEALLPRGRSRK